MQRRKKLLLLVLLSITILWLLACFQHVSAYNQMVEEKKQELGEDFVNRIVDFYPVWVWEWGELYLLGGLFISMGWIVSIYEFIKGIKKRINGRSKIMPLMASGIIVMLITISVNFGYVTQVRATPSGEDDFYFCPSNAIDLLFVSDEELRASRELVIVPDNGVVETWYSTRKIEEIIFPKLQKKFLEQAGISVAFNGWVSWDSNDSQHCEDFLLIEAMEETGWVPQEIYREREITISSTYDYYGKPYTYTENRRMDILVVISYQSMERAGIAMTPEGADLYSSVLGKTVYWDSCIVKYQWGDTQKAIQFIQHEITHLFGDPDPYYGFPHCPNMYCVMNPEWVHYIKVTWCSSCRDKLIAWTENTPSQQYPPH